MPLPSPHAKPPNANISGARCPPSPSCAKAMPYWMQMFTWINPVSHFSTIARGILLKGVGLEILYPHLLALVGFAFLLMFFSVRQFRKQLG
jgi:ABC-2 type transport system permease protein